jgi:hypothetical protein
MEKNMLLRALERKSQGTEKMKNRNEILINRKKIHRQGTTKGRE